MSQNPLMDRICERMRADDALGKLNRHWCVRLEKAVIMAPSGWLSRMGMVRLSEWWCAVLEPLGLFLHSRQVAFLRRYW